MLIAILLCSLPLALPVLASLAALVTFSAAPGELPYPLGSVADYGSFEAAPLPEGTATVRLAREIQPPRGVDGRYVKGPRTLPPRDSRGRFLSTRAPGHATARPSVL